MNILVIQETDWILRGPHFHHHIFSRLDSNRYETRIIDFPLIWDKDKRDVYPRFRNFHTINFRCKLNPSKSFLIYRSIYINFSVFNIISIFFQRLVIKKIIKNFQPDVIICLASLLNVNYVIRLCKKKEIPFINCLLEKYYTLVPIKILKKIAKRLEIKAIKNSKRNIVITKGLKDYTDIICESNKNVYIPQGIDLNHFDLNIYAQDKKKKYGITDNDIVLFFMGWIYKFSGIKEVVQTIKNADDVDIKLIIVGEGGIYNDLMRFVKRYNLKKNIILTGRVPYMDIPQYLSLADFCLLPAYNNNVMKDLCPIKIYEYLGMGKPVIATKLPGLIREVGYNNGIIYIENPHQTVKKAIEMIKYSKEEGKKARKFAEQYDWKVITEMFESFLNNIFSES